MPNHKKYFDSLQEIIEETRSADMMNEDTWHKVVVLRSKYNHISRVRVSLIIALFTAVGIL